ncbi:bifunctional folylpolyglutamate synthase/dihydrofolate synthase [Alkalihalophilus marmarensis]|uniref:bifunctional folylpolyglutamate synthase/dihydrofolate synthase n=1 Tax=Alkalihalophilus marmarensis TaxID=521377 RepID=UPI002DBBF7ED|nr:folylpolyglutamate synthase/dihydrofolate synthase family protein [Alkalihalophilus marmarensis]MEC2071627.1 bifunctional folylpolyglutamate synthase/dihydrofolate synthase [Alkalihalophilus marmarensis]
MRNVEEAIEWIHSLLPFGIKPGLKRMEWMLARLGHPERELKTIHIGGTNGKGSTVSYLRHMLEASSYKVGTFTSPYIECFEERISVNGDPIPGDDLLECVSKVKPLVEELEKTELGSPTEFEVITTIGFLYFATVSKPDFVLVEVGLGGRLDSTNVIDPLLSIITSIGHDHMHILGDSLEDIAFEKAGIIKYGKPVISGVSQPEAKQVLKEKAAEEKAALKQLNDHFEQVLITRNATSQMFSFYSQRLSFDTCTIQMAGNHQRNNAALALEAMITLGELGIIELDTDLVLKGLKNASWAGRFEVVNKEPVIILDGAHNEEGMSALAETLTSHYPDKHYKLIMAATKEKDMKKLLAPFETMDADFTFTTFDFFRAASERELYEQALVPHKRMSVSWSEAIKDAVANINDNEIIIVSGSLYFVSDVRRWLKESTALFPNLVENK